MYFLLYGLFVCKRCHRVDLFFLVLETDVRAILAEFFSVDFVKVPEFFAASVADVDFDPPPRTRRAEAVHSEIFAPEALIFKPKHLPPPQAPRRPPFPFLRR